MRNILRRILGTRSAPITVAIFVLILGSILVVAVNITPNIAIATIIFITLTLALLAFAITYISVDDDIRISPLVNRQYYVYEVLQSKLEWRIVSSDGSSAVLIKKRTIKFLQNNVKTLREYIWGDVYSSENVPKSNHFVIKPGQVSKIYQEGGKYVIVITLDKPYMRGETLDIEYQKIIDNGFLSTREWVEFMPVTNSKIETMRVIFPDSRKVIKQSAKFRYGDFAEELELGEKGFVKTVEDGRDVLEWVIKDPIARASYLIEWEW
jgi:hypothetical protein